MAATYRLAGRYQNPNLERINPGARRHKGEKQGHRDRFSFASLLSLLFVPLCSRAFLQPLEPAFTMNLELSIDARTVERARLAAQKRGKSLEQAVRDYLDQRAGRELLNKDLAAFEASAHESPGRLDGWCFDREQANRPA